jgi:acyl carrier protein
MELTRFVKLFADQFNETPADQFYPALEYKVIPEWSSLTSLSIIAMVDDEFDMQLNGDDIEKSNTLEDIFNLIKVRMSGE